MPSDHAVNKQDDVLIGYSRFSPIQFASANYSFRTSNDRPTPAVGRGLQGRRSALLQTFGSGRTGGAIYSSTWSIL